MKLLSHFQLVLVLFLMTNIASYDYKLRKTKMLAEGTCPRKKCTLKNSELQCDCKNPDESSRSFFNFSSFRRLTCRCGEDEGSGDKGGKHKEPAVCPSCGQDLKHKQKWVSDTAKCKDSHKPDCPLASKQHAAPQPKCTCSDSKAVSDKGYPKPKCPPPPKCPTPPKPKCPAPKPKCPAPKPKCPAPKPKCPAAPKCAPSPKPKCPQPKPQCPASKPSCPQKPKCPHRCSVLQKLVSNMGFRSRLYRMLSNPCEACKKSGKCNAGDDCRTGKCDLTCTGGESCRKKAERNPRY